MAISSGSQNWLVLYKKAVLEPDRKKMKTRITQAQAAIRRRARELWYAGVPPTGERHQMDAALHFLRLLSAVGSDT